MTAVSPLPERERWVAREIARVEGIALDARRRAQEVDEDVFGKRDHRGDRGAMGRLEQKVDTLVNWIQGLIGTIIGGVVVGMVIFAVQHIHGG